MKVERFRHANQFHLYGGNKHILQSYNSKVVEIENTNKGIIVTLGKDWDYSTTTSKYVYEFLEEYLPYYMVNFKGKTNKREYINNLIKEGIIGYDENMF